MCSSPEARVVASLSLSGGPFSTISPMIGDVRVIVESCCEVVPRRRLEASEDVPSPF